MGSYRERFGPALIRASAFVAAFIASVAVTSAVGALFHKASREPWLRNTPEARTAVDRCEARASREAGQACVKQLIVQAQLRDAGATRFAATPSAAASR